MRNPLKRYYFLSGDSGLKMFDCTATAWLWDNPQDAVTEVINMWRQEYGSVSIRSVTRL